MHFFQEFMLCLQEEKDPRKCIAEGKEVTRCGLEFFGKVKQNCYSEFTKYFECIDHSDRQMSLKQWGTFFGLLSCSCHSVIFYLSFYNSVTFFYIKFNYIWRLAHFVQEFLITCRNIKFLVCIYQNYLFWAWDHSAFGVWTMLSFLGWFDSLGLWAKWLGPNCLSFLLN